ncbi:MAG: hypothetical protein GX777_00980 [Fastidiosipila sp.]|nr:hypothetical protein [Fastidiosipila sp.]
MTVKKKPGRNRKQAKKRKNFFKKFNRAYPIYLVISGLLVGIILSIFTVGGVAIADLYGRVRSPDEIPQLQNPDWLEAEDNDFSGLPGADKTSGGGTDFDHVSVPREDLEAIFNGEFEVSGVEDKSEVSKSDESYDQAIQAVPLQSMDGIENILIIGTDTATFSGRSDVMIIASLNHNSRKLNLVSLYRAANVNIPGYGQNLLNAAYAFGGANLLIRTIENNFRIPINGYVIFNFNSFIKAIDVMGGVNLYLSNAEAAALGMNPGNNWATSSQALRYARLRKIDSDFYRMGRQRQVLNSVLNQLSASSATTIYNVSTVILPSVVTNMNVMPYVNRAHTYLSYSRNQMQIPRTSDMWMFYNRYGQEVGGFNHSSTANRLINFLTN